MAAPVEYLGMALLSVILFINIAIVAHDVGDTGISLTGAQKIGMDYEDVSSQYSPIISDTGDLTYSSGAPDQSADVKQTADSFNFIKSAWPTIINGFHTLLTVTIADSVEPETKTGTVHWFMFAISVVFYSMAMIFGTYGIVMKVASIIRGGGG